jgi:hypothetical protein
MKMYEMSLERCRQRQAELIKIRQEIEHMHGPSFSCSCLQKAKDAHPDLITRLNAGDELVVESILGFYQSCIERWANDVYHDPMYESYFKAELAARLVRDAAMLRSDTLCRHISLAACDTIIDHHNHIEEFHLAQMNEQAVTVNAAPLAERYSV